MKIIPIACLKDNYAYLLVCEQTNDAVIVDPSEAAPVQNVIDKECVTLKAIWNTHHHWDHTNGNQKLYDCYPRLTVAGHVSDSKRIPLINQCLDNHDTLSVGKEIIATVLHTPGHTLGAVSYYLEKDRALFTGDTLFGAGCGRLFEGTPAMLHQSLMTLSQLPPETNVYCGHEYTYNNLKFAAVIDPTNTMIQQRSKSLEKQPCSIPFSIKIEQQTNPFLRTTSHSVVDTVCRQFTLSNPHPVDVFAALRKWKDTYA